MRQLARSLAVCTPLLVLVTPASADPPQIRIGGTARGQGPIQPLRVEATMTVQIPIPAGADADAQLKLGESVRRAIYGTAARECATLKEVFGAECRLQSVRVNSNAQPRGNGGDILFVNGSASYELVEGGT